MDSSARAWRLGSAPRNRARPFCATGSSRRRSCLGGGGSVKTGPGRGFSEARTLCYPAPMEAREPILPSTDPRLVDADAADQNPFDLAVPPRTIASGTGSMKKDWNLRAQDNYQLAIASVHVEEHFLESGRNDADVLLRYLNGHDLSQWKALDYGCGVGRLIRPLAPTFAELHGLDISDEMVRIGSEQLADFSNVRLHVLEASSLPFPDNSFDLVYSIHVFQHMPKEAFRTLIPEVARILKPGGTFLFHLTYPYTFRRQVQALLGMDKPRTDTYRRRFYSFGRLRRLLGASGLEISRWDRTERKFAWYLAKANE